jgi:excisionase family DNA binding protein
MAKPRRLYPLMLSVTEVAAQLQCDRHTVYGMCEAGLPSYRCGTRQFVLTDDLIRFVRENFKRES